MLESLVRWPQRKARVLVITVAAWELLVWLPADVVRMFSGFDVARAVSLIIVHAIIGVSGILMLRQLPKE